MEEAIELIKITFDNLENRTSNCVIKESLGIFTESGKLTAHGNVNKFIHELPDVSVYLGWDGEVYPQYILKKHSVNN